MKRSIFVAIVAFAVAPVLAERDQLVFRSNADEVLVDVSVMRGKSPVTGLTAADFVLTDNGVRQSIRDVSVNAGDIDVTLVIQRAGVLSDAVIDPGGRSMRIRSLAGGPAVDHAAAGARRLIQPSDGLRILSANDEVKLGADTVTGATRSSILDGLVAAMMLKPTEVGRRQLIIGVTTGTDERSFVPAESRMRVALRTDAVVHIVALGDGQPAFVASRPYGTRGGMATAFVVGVAGAALKPIADATGGRLYQVDPGADAEKTLRPAIDEFRTRYLLRYIPTEVARTGWHDIAVTVPSGPFEIRHRRGYEISR